ncbi:hypothetical protein [Polyangium sp. 15x6]|uniref:hypothetical protein n=1 Tax=Polyangium sp. 15x6 TaxID=3042687 RepID=UPI00249A5E06|nr:hypothetical protein [Polyangium sp. 15x6]MDI3285393.1 hypothetical protein [Polyangium sp. 15x6]
MSMTPSFFRTAPLVALGLLGGCQVVLGIESELHLATCEDGEVYNTTPADCRREVCKDGELVTEPDPDDVRNDVNECTEDACDGTTPVNAPRAADSPCGLDGLLRCDGAGKCQGCVDDASCQSGPAQPCAPITCQQGICVTNMVPPGTLLPDPAPGDCMAPACGANGVATTVFAADPPTPPSPCIATVCMEGMAQSGFRNPGTACSGGVCDGSGNCVACLENAHCGGGTMVCLGQACVNHCTDGLQNHGETYLDCGGGCPGCGIGAPCMAASDCATNYCIEGICWDPGFGG